MGKLQTLRSRLIAGALGVALLGAGVGVGAAASEPSSPDTRPVSDVSVPTTAAPATTAAPTQAVAVVQAVPAATTTAPETIAAPAPAATVADVTTNAPQPQQAPQVISGGGAFGEDGQYTLAPVQHEGEPPVLAPPSQPIEYLPGEPGYTAPAD